MDAPAPLRPREVDAVDKVVERDREPQRIAEGTSLSLHVEDQVDRVLLLLVILVCDKQDTVVKWVILTSHPLLDLLGQELQRNEVWTPIESTR